MERCVSQSKYVFTDMYASCHSCAEVFCVCLCLSAAVLPAMDLDEQREPDPSFVQPWPGDVMLVQVEGDTARRTAGRVYLICVAR
mmetsp:Transcript_9270/g.22751  ORF Transcript_9270/g.22751 Transcript_9270/m.22751 type:complete len:85 (-) Transcript_9270:1927-2181(-)